MAVSPFDVDERKYESVAAYTTTTRDYVIANGDVFDLREMGGNGVNDPNVEVQVIWDADGSPEILLSVHGDTVQKSTRMLTGNGVKVMRIKLINNSGVDRTIGGYYLGRQS